MNDRIVSVEREATIAVVRFDRRGSLNAFNQTLIRELTAVARDFHDDLETRAVVLTGSRAAFSAGIDLRDAETWSRAASDVAAREQFEAGRIAYEGGDYEAALGHFEAAYKRSGRPRLLYNIGLAADRVRENERALEAFRAYLAALPDADKR